MATDTAPTTGSIRHAWQVPLFFAGLLALAGVLAFRVSAPDPDFDAFTRDLAQVRKALLRTGGPRQDDFALAELLVGRAEHYPEQLGIAHFLLGSLYLAREGGGDDVVAKFELARRHLEEAERAGVSPDDRDRLRYRLGRVYALSGDDPQRVIDYLALALPDIADDPAEGYGLLAQTYLRLATPNLHAALEANQKQLALPIRDEGVVAAARLLRGEILLKLQQGEEARKVLARVAPNAPPAIFQKARQLRAESSVQDALWKDAAELWKAIVDDPRTAAAERDQARYFLGVCLAKDGRAEDALAVWNAAREGGGISGQAAAWRYAEWQLPRDAESAGQALDQLLGGLSNSDPYANTLVPLPEARAIAEMVIRRFIDKGDYARAEKLAARYVNLAERGKSHELDGEAADAWAKARLEKARLLENGDEKKREEEAANAQWIRAGAAYEAAAGLAGNASDRAEFLEKSAERFRRGGDLPRALDALKRLVVLDLPGERLGDGWCKRAEIYQALGQDINARGAYRQAIAYPGAAAYRARYELAMAHIKQSEWAEAQEHLQHSLTMQKRNGDGDEALEPTVYALAEVQYRQGQYDLATSRFHEALELFPASKRAASARFQLADCYRKLAAKERTLAQQSNPRQASAQTHHQEQEASHWSTATAEFQKLAQELTDRQAKDKLSEAEETLLRQSALYAADCLMEAKNYDTAIKHYQVLSGRFHEKEESLNALAQIVRCQLIIGTKELSKSSPDRQFALLQAEQTRKALSQLEEALRNFSAETQQRWQSHPAIYRKLLADLERSAQATAVPEIIRVPSDK